MEVANAIAREFLRALKKSPQSILNWVTDVSNINFNIYTVLHIFRQVLFGAGNQGNHKNFDLSCIYLKKNILSNMQFLSPYFVVTKVQIANQQMHLASMNMQMKA